MTDNLEIIRRSLRNGKDRKLREAFQKLMGMGFTAEESYSALANLKDNAEEDAYARWEAEERFSQFLKQLLSGKYSREYLQQLAGMNGIAGVISAKEPESLDELLKNYDKSNDSERMYPEDAVKYYYNARDDLKEMLDSAVRSRNTILNNLAVRNVEAADLMTGIMQDLNDTDQKGTREALKLGKFIYRNFTFKKDTEEELEQYHEFLKTYAKVLDSAGRYYDCDKVLAVLEKENIGQAELAKIQFSLLNRRNQKEDIEKARKAAIEMMNDPDFPAGEGSAALILEVVEFFQRINDAENEEKALSLLPDKKETDSQISHIIRPYITAVSLAVDEMVERNNPPELAQARQHIVSMGYTTHEATVILSALVSASAFQKPDKDTKTMETAASAAMQLSKEAMDNLLRIADLSLMQKLSILINGTFDQETVQDVQYTFSLLLKEERNIDQWISGIQAGIGTNSYAAFCEKVQEDDIDFNGFIDSCLNLLETAGDQAEKARFASKILSMFAFKDEEIEAKLKAAAA